MMMTSLLFCGVLLSVARDLSRCEHGDSRVETDELLVTLLAIIIRMKVEGILYT